MLVKHSQRALKGALYTVGYKIMGHPVSIPCKQHLKDADGYIEVKNNGLTAKFVLTRGDNLSVQLFRNQRMTLLIVLPYSVAACFVPSPVSFIEREL